MKVCKEAKKGARILFDAAHTNGKLDESKVRLVLSEVVSRRPQFHAQILQELHRLVRLELESRAAVVQTASVLSPAEQQEMQVSLQGRFGSDLSVTFAVNEDLIAGIRLKVGSDVYDANVKERLARLRHELSH
jgi:F-type H+-transporting ATPase subunit delta